jgi:hypothetical protein
MFQARCEDEGVKTKFGAEEVKKRHAICGWKRKRQNL